MYLFLDDLLPLNPISINDLDALGSHMITVRDLIDQWDDPPDDLEGTFRI